MSGIQLEIRFRSGTTLSWDVADEQDAERVLRALGANVEGWFGDNPKVLLDFENGAAVINRREVESAMVRASRSSGEGGEGSG